MDRITTTRSERVTREFLSVPRLVYRNDPLWISPLESEIRRTLDTRKNPYFANASLKLFVTSVANRPVARASVVINRLYEKKYNEKVALFGFFESVNDSAVARALIADIEEYCRAQQVTRIEGPFNPNHYSELGMQVNGFGSEPVFFQTYNPPYYNDLLNREGFQASARIFTARNDTLKKYLASGYKHAAVSDGSGYRCRGLDPQNEAEDLEQIRQVFNDSFAENWHFLPSSAGEFAFGAASLRHITRPDLVRIIEKDGRAVGALVLVLDINPPLKRFNGRRGPVKLLRFFLQKRRIDRVIVYAVGIRREYQRSRATALLTEDAARVFEQFESVAASWMLESNRLSVRLSERFGMKPDKEFLIYTKHLPDTDEELTIP